jgi:chemotaxis protein CheY-P-specific phosphatase CheC
MTSSVAKRRNDRELNARVTEMVESMAQSLGALVDRPLRMRVMEQMHVMDKHAWVDSMSRPKGLIRGELDQDYEGRSIGFMFDVKEAATLACCLMLAPDEVIKQRRKTNTMTVEDLEAFGEVGNIICSGIDDVLGHVIGHNIGLQVQDHEIISRDEGSRDYLPDGDLVIYSFLLGIDHYEGSEGFLVFDLKTAERLNAGPLEVDDSADPLDTALSSRRGKQNKEEPIPQAPIRGKLSTYLSKTEADKTIRRSCRRVGLELQRFAKQDIPNPAAHKNEFVLIEVPVGEDRRFDWAKRLKDHPRCDITVILLLHAPSRRRVVQGCLAKADTIVAWPCTEPQLSEKLRALLDGELKPPEEEEDDLV